MNKTIKRLTIMKKTYIQPSIELEKVTLDYQILTGSDAILGYGDQKDDDIYTSGKEDFADMEEWK